MDRGKQRPARRAQKAQQPDRHIDVHEQLAASLIRTDRQKAEHAQRQAKPCWNQRRWMHAAGTKIADQTKSDQARAANTSVTFATRDLRTFAWQGYQLHAHVSLPANASLSDAIDDLDGIYCAQSERPRPRLRTWDIDEFSFTAECEPIRPWQTPPPGPASPWSCRRGTWSAARHAPSPA